MRRTSVALACACSLLVTFAGSANADPQKGSKRRVPEGAPVTGRAVERDSAQSTERGNGPAVQRHGRTEVRVDERDAWRDGDRCRVIVTEYYGHRSLPPGLARKQSLPPGLRKQLRERGHLPPGLEKRWVVLPVELERRLPPLPPHYMRRAVDGDLLVIDVRTNFVVSIMAGVFISR